MIDFEFIDAEEPEVNPPGKMFFVYDDEFPPEDLVANKDEIHLWFSNGDMFSLVDGVWVRCAVMLNHG